MPITGSQLARFEGFENSTVMWPPILSLSLSKGARVGGGGAGFCTVVGGLPLLNGGGLTEFFFNPSKYLGT